MTQALPQERAPALRPPRHRVERRAILLWTLNAIVTALVSVGGLGLTYGLWEASRPYVGPLLAVAAVFAAVNILAMPTWRYLVHRWEFTDRAVYNLDGWITREWRITPISRIQSIDTKRGPLQALLGLTTLKVTTAAKAGSIAIRGLDARVAAEAAERLTDITQDTPGDAT
ncbi:PH domain-containing protein [Dactylosporangium sp. NPDC005572]|uniref:PH domain-containing protein n=1 Tax=Dactylosporangium sp. NPDC005572 TaxID=3156889 RepID=UPI0033B7EFD8